MSSGAMLRRDDPRNVTGYEHAVALGLTPRVPMTPPQPIRNRARTYRRLSGVLALGWLGLSASVIYLLSTAEQGVSALPFWSTSAVSVALAAMLYPMKHLERRVAHRDFTEGFCRIDEVERLVPRHDPERRFSRVVPFGYPAWDLRGLWRLDEDGDVVRTPSPGVLPPGHYPSPHRPGQLELWTGVVWAYDYRDPAQRFVEH